MCTRLSQWIQRISNGWLTLITLILFLLFTALILPAQTARIETDVGDARSPDMSFYYTPAELYQMAESYGEDGRQAYIKARFTFDLIWPLIYMMFFTVGISWVYGRAFELDSPLQRVNLVPVLGALFDYLENLSTSLVMARYPNITVGVDTLATIFTMVKWIFVGGSMVLLLGGTVTAFWRWVRSRSKK